MKKLMIAAAIVCAAAFAQAGAITWGTGSMMLAAGSTGGWTEKSMAEEKVAFTFQVFMVTDTEVWSDLLKKDQAGLYEWSKDQTATYEKNSYNSSTEVYSGGLAVQKTGTPSQVADYNAVAVVFYTDANYGEMYMATTAPVTSAGNGNGQKQGIFGVQGSGGGIRDWQAVPEPTSGLLLLLGVAGLALRRRRA